MQDVAALFVRADTCYRLIPGVQVWDEARDARRYRGGLPVVAHPPCREWGRLRTMSKAPDLEAELAPYAVEMARKWGGVVEHPAHSLLWLYCALPKPGSGVDQFGGFTLPVNQRWWGHRADKRTWLYVVGVSPFELPELPYWLGQGEAVVDSGKRGGREYVTHREREATPIDFACWLVECARRVGYG